MTSKYNIRQKMLVLLLVIVAAIISMSAIVSIYRGVALTGDILGRQAYIAASQAYRQIDSEKVKKVINDMNDTSPDYMSVRDKLFNYREGLGLKYLYIMTKNSSGDYIYLVDGSDPNTDEFSKLGDVETDRNYYSSYDKAMNGEIVRDDITIGERWGDIVSVYFPIKDKSGTVIAFLGADLEATEVLGMMNRNTMIIIISIFIIGSIGVLLAYRFSSKFSKPIIALRDFSLDSSNFEDMKLSNFSSIDEIADIAMVLNNKIRSVKNIMDNTGEGFLSFGNDLLIEPEYSSECKKIFETDNMEGKSFPELLFQNDPENIELAKRILKNIFEKTNDIDRNVYISLLSSEVNINKKNISMEYKIINDANSSAEKFMVVLKDITEKRKLEEKIEEEKKTMKMVIKIMANFNDFCDVVKSYHLFCDVELYEIIGSEKSCDDIIYEIYRNIHTFKGDFCIFELCSIVEKLHTLEDEILHFKNEAAISSKEDIRQFFTEKNISHWLDEDFITLKNTIGDQFTNKILKSEKSITIDTNKIDAIIQIVQNNFPEPESSILIPEIKKLKYRKFSELMKSYPDYIIRIADRLSKQIEMPSIDGGDFLVDSDRYKNLINALSHVFRNAVDHGIEYPDDRIEKNKNESGTIKCSIKKADDDIIISITDDGQGIECEKVVEKAVEKGIISPDRAANLSEDEKISLIFKNEVSTKNSTSVISGRGMGLPALMSEVIKLKGSVIVSSKPDYGTEFNIIVPYME